MTLRSVERARGFVHHRTPTLDSFEHADLQALDADDHPQYLTEVRGDARYYTEAEVDALLAAQDALSELTDVVITTPVDGNVLYYNGTNWVNTATLSVRSDGIQVVGSSDHRVYLGPATTGGLLWWNPTQYVEIFGYENSSFIQARARSSAGVARLLFLGDPNAGITLYNLGVAELRTSDSNASVIQSGAEIKDVDGNWRGVGFLEELNVEWSSGGLSSSDSHFGKRIRHIGGGSDTYTLFDHPNVRDGMSVTLINSTGTVTITPDTGVSLRWLDGTTGGGGATGSRTIANASKVEILKHAINVYYLTGNGIT